MVSDTKTTPVWLYNLNKLQKTMRSKALESESRNNLFKMRFDDVWDKKHALVYIAETIHQDLLDNGLRTELRAATGVPALLTRLMAGLMYLQHRYNLSDEAFV